MSQSTMMTMPLLMGPLLDRGARVQPSNLLITRTSTGYVTITYREHLNRAKQLAAALSAWGVKRGDRVATLCWNTNRHLQCYHAIPCMGAVLHTLNIRLGPMDQGYIIRFSEDKVIIVDFDMLEKLVGVSLEDLQTVGMVIICGMDEKSGGWQSSPLVEQLRAKMPGRAIVDWDEFLAPHPPVFNWPTDLDENAPMALCYTSGTTGRPKGVVYSHRAQYIHTIMMVAPNVVNLAAHDVLIPVVPYFHANGWGLPYCGLMLGVRIVHNSRFTDPASILEMAIEQKATMSAAVPTVWQTVRATLQAEEPKYRGKFKLRQIICGGSAPPNEMMKWYWDTYRCEFAQIWGMTELSPFGTVARQVSTWEHAQQPPHEQFVNVTKQGVPVPTVQTKIVDPENYSIELPQDGKAQGEFLCWGPHVTGSYYNNPEAQKSFPQGWLATGDVASIDELGNMIIRDRSKDAIKSGGEWISSVKIESNIAAMPQVTMCAVVGHFHPKWDERPVAVVVLKEKQTLTLKQVQDHLLGLGFSKFELPDDLLAWSAIPLTGALKMDKKVIRKTLEDRKYTLPGVSKL